MLEALGFEFMRNALLAGLLAGIACGIIGTLVVVNRIVFISGGIAHAAYGGVGLAVVLGFSPLLGIMGFALVVSIIMALASLKIKHRADTIIGVLWAAGMALGVVLLDLSPGYNVDLISYLFGSILTVPNSDLWLILGLDLVVVAAVGYYYHGLVSLAYDEEFAQVRGVPVEALYILLMVLVALSVVMMVQIVGLILVIALLTIPPSIAEKFAGSIGWMMIYAIVLNMIFTTTGLWLSYRFNLTSGASIIIVAVACFGAAQVVESFLKRARARAGAA